MLLTRAAWFFKSSRLKFQALIPRMYSCCSNIRINKPEQSEIHKSHHHLTNYYLRQLLFIPVESFVLHKKISLLCLRQKNVVRRIKYELVKYLTTEPTRRNKFIQTKKKRERERESRKKKIQDKQATFRILNRSPNGERPSRMARAKYSGGRACLKKWCFKSFSEVGRFFGSFTRQAATNSLKDWKNKVLFKNNNKA